MARVRLDIGGLEMRISGVRITTNRDGTGLFAELPCHPSAERGWQRAVALPRELEHTIGRLVCDAAREAGIR